MFEALTEKLTAVFRQLGDKGRITEQNVDDALRAIRLALLEADVNFKVARDFVTNVRAKAIGEGLLKGISPGEQMVKIVHNEMVSLLSGGEQDIRTTSAPPNVIMLVGLQGSGKTTTAAKLAMHLRHKSKTQSILMVAADLRRPGATDQLISLGRQLDIPVHAEPLAPDQAPRVAINGVRSAQSKGIHWVIVDTGGRLQIDDDLMHELVKIKAEITPVETLLVVDAMTGQEAVNTTAEFHSQVGLTGLILSKLDGDARGGAALAANYVTGVPIKFAGTGEKSDAFEPFHPDRMASRILGMGDVLTLVEKAQEQISEAEAKEMEWKFRRAEFDLDDFLKQLRQVQKLGSLTSIMEMVPGFNTMRSKLPIEALDDRRLKRVESVISSMTLWERHHADRIDGSRRRRIAKGSGTLPADVNQVLAQFRQAQKLMKHLAAGKRGGFNLPGF
jgi:signal recognition particle subunit SRP54